MPGFRWAGERVHHVLTAPVTGLDGQRWGVRAALGRGAEPLQPGARSRLEWLGAHLPAELLSDTSLAGESARAPRGVHHELEVHPPGVLQALQLGGWAYDAAARRLRLGAAAAALLGMDRQAPGLDSLLHSCAEDSARRLRRAFVACLREGTPIDEEIQLRPDGEQRRWIRFVGEPASGGAGASTLAIQGTLQDVSSRKQAQEETLRLAMRLTTTLASITEAFVALDLGGRFTYVNRESERLLGLRTVDLLERPIWSRLEGLQPGLLQARIGEALAGNRRVEFEDFYPALGKWIELRAYPYAEGLAVYFRDVSERKAAEAKIHRLAFYDALTDLPNRAWLMEHLAQALADNARPRPWGALMFIDLDDFKVLNDTLGHHMGDLLLQRVAQRLKGCVRSGDWVARIGGDEFVVVLQGLGGDAGGARRSAQAVAAKVLAGMATPFELEGHQHHSTVSIGVALFDAGHGGMGELLKQADLAMYHAKHQGRNAVAFFDPPMLAALSATAELAIDLRGALAGGQQFVLHYQPLSDMAGRITGVEALLRWHHPRRGLVLPGEFIPVAEDTGLIVALGLWVLGQACRQVAAWQRREETAGLTISVNVSARQFRHPDFVAQVLAALQEHGAPPRLIRLELTESLMADRLDATLAQMNRLRQLGVGLSLDDFGTGYSSLAYLKHLPLDQLKIDRVFVADVVTDPGDANIARAIIAMAHSLGLAVVAEGVETEAQRQFLAEHGCDQFQGHLLAQPMPLEFLEAFMARRARQHRDRPAPE